MMAGVATVGVRNHDVDLFVRNEVNGLFGDTADEPAEQILSLYRNPSFCKRDERRVRALRPSAPNLDLPHRSTVVWQ